MLLLFSTLGCSADESKPPDPVRLEHNQTILTAIDQQIAESDADARHRCVLKGLRWCVIFCDNEMNFNFTFSNYITMLSELALHSRNYAFTTIVHELIKREFERALPRLPALFDADESGFREFITILPIAYLHQLPVKPLRDFANQQFSDVNPSPRIHQFRRAAKQLDYDLLTDLVIDAAFVDMAYKLKIDRVFRLPPNEYQLMMSECATIAFSQNYGDDRYHDQNYYATHVLLALNHYGQKPLLPSAVGDRVFLYLAGQYETIRRKLEDLDLLCEYLYCFKQFAPMRVEFITEGEHYVMSRQNEDGSWGTPEDFEGDPYDRLHPTWTAITLLVQDP